ncbi:MAG: hypothetical protein R3C59_26465 [Planctomycetaceae bacterium]
MKRLSQSSRPACRRATVSVVVVVVLMLIMALVAQYTRQAMADRRQLRVELRAQQTVQLAEAGILRLRQQRSTDTGYSGETWNLPAGTIHQTNSARVTISIQDNAATVVALYPVNSPNPLKITRTVRLE